MRGRLRKEMFSRFSEALPKVLPRMELLYKDPPNSWVWNWKIESDLTLFIHLQASERSDEFRVEVAWTKDSEMSWWSARFTESPQSESGRTTLRGLWTKGCDYWDLDPEARAEEAENLKRLDRGELMVITELTPLEQVLPRVLPSVQDAIDKLQQYGLPLFRQVVSARGYTWPAA